MDNSTPTYRTALVGCGGRGMALLRTADQINRIQFVAASDLNGINFDQLTSAGIPVYRDLEQMLERESVDLVIVATPITTHYRVATQVLSFPITGLYLEKSMVTRLWEADDLISRAEEAGIFFVVGHQLRYTPSWAGVKNMIQENVIGKINYIRAHRGAALLTHHTHQTDLMRYYLDDVPVSWVLGQLHRDGSHLSEGLESEMQALGFVQFENGVSGIIESGQYNPSAGNHLMLIGEKGEIRVGSSARFRNVDTGGEWQPLPQYDQPHIFESFLEWIGGGEEHRCSARKGRDTLEVLLSIYESCRQRRRIELPLQERGNALEEMVNGGILP